MATNRESLHQCQLLKGKLPGDMQFPCGKCEKRAHPAVAVYPEGLMAFTAVGVAGATRVASLAVDVRLD
jgi:hypothetical protein